MNIMSDRNTDDKIFSIQEKIGLLEKKVADLEYELEEAKKEAQSKAYIIALRNELAAKEYNLVELRKEKFFLLESQKASGTMIFLLSLKYLT